MKTKTKRKICEMVFVLAMLAALGVGGSVELGTMPLAEGAIKMLLWLIIAFAGAYKGGMFL